MYTYCYLHKIVEHWRSNIEYEWQDQGGAHFTFYGIDSVNLSYYHFYDFVTKLLDIIDRNTPLANSIVVELRHICKQICILDKSSFTKIVEHGNDGDRQTKIFLTSISMSIVDQPTKYLWKYIHVICNNYQATLYFISSTKETREYLTYHLANLNMYHTSNSPWTTYVRSWNQFNLHQLIPATLHNRAC